MRETHHEFVHQAQPFVTAGVTKFYPSVYELAEFGITCNVVGPTPVKTDLIRSVPADKIDRIVNSLAIKRLGSLEDIANVIDFFVKPESDYVTGQVIYLGGI